MTDSTLPSTPDALPIGTHLGDFKITNTIGFGGFGMVYLAYEKLLDRTVAIKEYLPVAIAGRASDQTVRVRSADQIETYEAGLKSFVREAQLQARFSHPAMLEVYRVWEQNSTAYMAMRYYPGTSLRDLRKAEAHKAGVTQDLIRVYLEPVCDAVRELHAQNVMHRDISPDNILIMANESPVLLDFGAARAVTLGGDQQLTTVLKPGYAPIEQYSDDGAMAQGPWTDVYALGAVIYYLVVGNPPPQPVSRLMNATLKDFDAIAPSKYSANFIEAVRRALAVKPEDRFQTVDDLCELLGWDAAPRTFFKSGVAVGRDKEATNKTFVASERESSSTPKVSRKTTARDRDRTRTRAAPVTSASIDTAATVVVTKPKTDPRTARPAEKQKPITVAPLTEDAATRERVEAKIAQRKTERVEISPQPAATSSAQRRPSVLYWIAVPVIAVVSFAIYRVSTAPSVNPAPTPTLPSMTVPVEPQQKVAPIGPQTVNPNALPSNTSVPIPMKDVEAVPKSASTPPTQSTAGKKVVSEPVQTTLPGLRSVEPIERSQSDTSAKRDTPAVAPGSDSQRAPTLRVDSTPKRAQTRADDKDATSRDTVRTSADNAAECERLYAKLSLGTSELSAGERERLAKCR